MRQTDNKLYHLLRAMRPRQWVKNVVVFAPIVFAGVFFVPKNLYMDTLAFLYFSFIASAIYLINDCLDIEKDRLHPVKKNRPFASGALPVSWGWTVSILIFIFFIPSSFIVVGNYFGVVLLMYVFLQFAYNLKLKNVIIMDALTIAIGFILRVFAGALAIPVSISSWLILAVIGGALLLAFGKRRAERTLLEAKGISKESTRNILSQYPDSLLDSMISMSSAFAIISYSLFAFQVSPESALGGILDPILPSTLVGAKMLMLTIPVVIYGVARYLYVIYEKREGESPERVLFQDKPLLATAFIWGIMVLAITN
jgi:4-hydroxybenzoate polyprenyltransferase